VIARVQSNGLMPGDVVSIELTNVDTGQRRIEFKLVQD
jgi:translation initiation factor IF-1